MCAALVALIERL